MHRLLIAIVVVASATHAQAQLGGPPNPDADRDGRVTLAEFRVTQLGRQDRAFGLLDRNKDGKMDAAEMARARRMAPTLRSMDGDKDGAVSRKEMEAGGEARFHAADANRDGWLSREELIVLRQGAGGGQIQ